MVVVTVQPASVQFAIYVEYTDAASATTAASSLGRVFTTMEDANDFLSSADITVVSVDPIQVKTREVPLDPDTASTSEFPIGVVAAAVGGLALVGLAAYVYRRRSSSARRASTQRREGKTDESSFSSVAPTGSTPGPSSRSSSSLPLRGQRASARVAPAAPDDELWLQDIELPQARRLHARGGSTGTEAEEADLAAMAGLSKRELAREKSRRRGNLLHVQMFQVADELGESSFSNLRTQGGNAPRFEAADLIFGMPQNAAKGVEEYLCVDRNDLLKGQLAGLQGIIDEVEANGTKDDKECLDYVLNREAGSSSRKFQGQLKRDCDDKGVVLESRLTQNRVGMRLADFVAHEHSRAAKLTDVEVACLRFYTTKAYQTINNELRNQTRYKAGEPHPLPLTVLTIRTALGKLRVIESNGPRANEMLHLYRGMAGRQVPSSFLQGGRGGTELAPMSSTTLLKIAMQYAASEKSLLLRILTDNFMSRGPQISFLSAFPAEEEFLFPPLTYLQPVGQPQVLRVDDATFTVIDVKPQS